MSQFSKEWRDVRPAMPVAHVTATGAKTRSKYHAVPHCVLPDLRVVPAAACDAVPGRIRFASKREAERFVVLRLEQEAGAISELAIQPVYPLHAVTPQGVKVCVCRYLGDFQYMREGNLVVEDAKGVRTAVYVLKKKMVEAEYGIEVIEV